MSVEPLDQSVPLWIFVVTALAILFFSIAVFLLTSSERVLQLWTQLTHGAVGLIQRREDPKLVSFLSTGSVQNSADPETPPPVERAVPTTTVQEPDSPKPVDMSTLPMEPPKPPSPVTAKKSPLPPTEPDIERRLIERSLHGKVATKDSSRNIRGPRKMEVLTDYVFPIRREEYIDPPSPLIEREISTFLRDTAVSRPSTASKSPAVDPEKATENTEPTKTADSVEIDSKSASLRKAVCEGDEAMVRELLETPSYNLEERNGEPQTLLECAAERGHEEIARLLLSHGASLHNETSTKVNALGIAASNSRGSIVALFLDWKNMPHTGASQKETGAKISMLKDAFIFTRQHSTDAGPLHSLIVASKASNVNFDKAYETILTMDMFKNDKEVILLALDSIQDQSIKKKALNNGFFAAVSRNDYEITQLFLDAGVRVNFGRGKALLEACQRGSQDMAQLLLERGASPDLTWNSEGESALEVVISLGNTSLLRLLLDKGAMVTRNKAVCQAAACGSIASLKLLIEYG